MRVKGESVDDRRYQSCIGDDLDPLRERQVGGGRDRGALLSLGENLEHQLRPAGFELHVTQFVEQQQVDSSVTGDEAREALLLSGFGEFVHQLRAGDATNTLSHLERLHPETNERVALAGARVAVWVPKISSDPLDVGF